MKVLVKNRLSLVKMYNLADDLGKTKYLSKVNPVKLKDMLAEWKIFKKVGVILKEKGD